MNEALKQASDSLVNRKLEAEKMIQSNDIEGVANLILCKEKMERYKKKGDETHKLCVKYKEFLAKKGLTGEFYDWYVLGK